MRVVCHQHVLLFMNMCKRASEVLAESLLVGTAGSFRPSADHGDVPYTTLRHYESKSSSEPRQCRISQRQKSRPPRQRVISAGAPLLHYIHRHEETSPMMKSIRKLHKTEEHVNYVDIGTQYSPESYPPTAGAEKMTAIDEMDYGHASYSKSRQQPPSSRPRCPTVNAANGEIAGECGFNIPGAAYARQGG